MGVNGDVKKWFANMRSVMSHLGSLKMAQQALADGKKYSYRYVSPSNSKSYNANQIVNIFAGTYDAADATDREFYGLILQQDNLLNLYLGYAQSNMAHSQARSFVVRFISYNYNELGGYLIRVSSKSYGHTTINNLYTKGSAMGSVAYPLNVV